jgi:hypothetical protein
MHQPFDHDNPDILWVHPDAPDIGCTGVFENPFSTLEAALDRVKPGQTIVLMAGEYVGDCNIQVSGTIRNPIRICAEPGNPVTIKSACWFFYDTSDLIVADITFTDALFGAISVIGTCNRNRFENLHFVNCGTRGQTACTFYMGGAGGGCNIVEACDFENDRLQMTPPGRITTKPFDTEDVLSTMPNGTAAVSVGILLAQGDADSGEPIVKNIIRKNRFSGYGYGIIVGSDESRVVRCGHIIEYNTMNWCSREGILVKSGDTTVRGNIVTSCGGVAIGVQSELDCHIEGNRIVESGTGIQIHGKGHTIANNCIVDCREGAIRVRGFSESKAGPAINCFIERNSLVNCTSLPADDTMHICGVLIDPGTTGIIQQNLIFGSGKPYAVVAPSKNGQNRTPEITRFVIKDNCASGGCTPAEGVGCAEIIFTDAKNGDYGTTGECGASGWVVTPEGFNPSVDDNDGEIDYREASILEDEEGNLLIPGEDERGNLFGNFFAEELSEEQQENDMDQRPFWYPGDAD